MRADFLDVDVSAAVGDGMGIDVRLYRDKWLQIYGTFTATLDVEISLNGGADYVKIHTGVNAPGLYEIPQTCTHLLIATTAWTSGTPLAVLSGLNTRTD